MIPKKYVWLLHVLGCMVFLSLPYFTSPDTDWNNLWKPSPMLSKDLVQFVLLIFFFYFHYFFLIPKLCFRRKYLLYVLSLAVCMCLIAYIPGMLIHVNYPWMAFREGMKLPGGFMPHRPRNFFFARINHNFFLFLAVVFFSLLIRIINRLKETEQEKLNTELSYLKAQINPHFLFNTLNSIYSLAIQKSDSTAPAIQKLSAMMRYVLNESAYNFVPLKLEIAYISNYIELQKLRFGQDLHLHYAVSGDPEKKDIAPLILIPFIENAFKYGVNAEKDPELDIRLSISNRQLDLFVMNHIVNTQVSNENQSGIGLSNTRNRLNLIYPGKHRLEIIQESNKYTVKLSIELK
jgi:hypothetical protein